MRDIGRALDYAQRALHLLDECGGVGPEFPQRDYLVCYQVLSAVGQDRAALRALEGAYKLVMARAARISDPGLRRSFLERVPTNGQIVQEALREHIAG